MSDETNFMIEPFCVGLAVLESVPVGMIFVGLIFRRRITTPYRAS